MRPACRRAVAFRCAKERPARQLEREVSRLLRLGDVRTRIVFPESLTSVRSASFTASESGKISATSGDKRTRFVPAAYRAAYLPRTPAEKSISGTGEAEWDLPLFFRILMSLASIGVPSTENASDIPAICVTNDEKIRAIRHSEKIVPPFAFGMLRIWHRDGVPIRERRCRFIERHAVLSEVLCRLLRIPVKLHSRSLREAAGWAMLQPPMAQPGVRTRQVMAGRSKAACCSVTRHACRGRRSPRGLSTLIVPNSNIRSFS